MRKYTTTPHIGVILAVEHQCLQRRIGIARGGGNILHNVLQHRLNISAQLCRNFRRIQSGQPDDVLHLLLGLQRIGGRQVNFIEHRKNFQIVIHGQIGVGQRLGLHALRGIHHQQRPLTGGQRAGNLIVKVHMTRGVNQIQGINLPVLRLVKQVDGPGLNGDAALPLQIHIIQKLVLHLSCRHGIALFQQTICQCGFAVVNVGDDGEIANMRLIEHEE